MNQLLNALAKQARTWNDAASLSTTSLGQYGPLMDYFFKCGTYRGRPIEQVATDMPRVFASDPELALKLVFGLRLITRKPKTAGEEVSRYEEAQAGFGLRDEFYKVVAWLHDNRPADLYRNLHLVPVFGAWRDFLTEPLLSTLDRTKVYELCAANLNDPLLQKYLPQIRVKGKQRSPRDTARVDWAKGFCKHIGISAKEYRKLKAAGTAHIWQKQMQRGQWDTINFNGVPGRAMTKHTTNVGRKDKLTVFERHGQVERLRAWVAEQPAVKFTGYPYELMKAVRPAHLGRESGVVARMIADRQHRTVLEQFGNHQLGNVLACLDISASMTSWGWNNASVAKSALNTSPYDICLSMGVSFSMLNTGYFKDIVCGFSDEPIVVRLAGEFTDRIRFLQTDEEFQRVSWGSTNFQGVIDMLVRMRQGRPEIPVEEYPSTILVISDMQFNPVGMSSYLGIPRARPGTYANLTQLARETAAEQTNYEAVRQKLTSVGLGNTRIIWWCVNGNTTDFPSNLSDPGVYMIGGFDPINLKALMGLNVTRKTETPASLVGELGSSPLAPSTPAVPEQSQETPLDGLRNFLAQPIFDLVRTS